MDWNQIAGNWGNVKNGLQQKWPELSDEDLDRIDGKRELLTGVIQAKYAISRDEAESAVNDWQNNQGSQHSAATSNDAKYNPDYTGADAGKAVDKQGQPIDDEFSNGKTIPDATATPGGNTDGAAQHQEKSIDQT